MEIVGYYKELVFADSDWVVRIQTVLCIYHALLSDSTALLEFCFSDSLRFSHTVQCDHHGLPFFYTKGTIRTYPGWHHTPFTFQSSSLAFCFSISSTSLPPKTVKIPHLHRKQASPVFPIRQCWAWCPLSFLILLTLSSCSSFTKILFFLFIHMWIFWSLLYSVHVHFFFTLVIIECLQSQACAKPWLFDVFSTVAGYALYLFILPTPSPLGRMPVT